MDKSKLSLYIFMLFLSIFSLYLYVRFLIMYNGGN